MADEAAKSGGLWLPYPILGFLLTLTIIVVTGLVGLYSQLSAMNTTMILRDSTYQQQLKKTEDEAKLQSMYIVDLRERIIRMEASSKKKGGG